MSDDLLRYYHLELNHIRRAGAEFAETHPDIAGSLRISRDGTEDPHVSRLIEAFAYLTARIRHKLDDDFPELTDALLGVLYPHYMAPVPSMAILQFDCKDDIETSFSIAAGTEMESEPVDGEVCRFRTCYPVDLWPIGVDAASLSSLPLVAPANRVAAAQGAESCLRLQLRCLAPERTFTKLGMDRLRFFLRGPTRETYPLYELIFNNTVSVALANGVDDPNPVILPPDSIRPVGFGRDEGMLPYPARSFPGYRLLTEFFTFPDKFLFFDVTGLSAKLLLEAGNKLEIFLYLNRTMPDLERGVSGDSFALGCTPMINLFRQQAAPVRLTRTVSEYRIEPDPRRPKSTEIYSIDTVRATAPDGADQDFEPFYSIRHAGHDRTGATFWHAARRLAAPSLGGTDMALSLVDLNFDPAARADWTVSVGTTCLNRDLPQRLPFGGGARKQAYGNQSEQRNPTESRPLMGFAEGTAPVTRITCLTQPTPTHRPGQRKSGRWRLISHLALNHLSLTDGADGTAALKEILKLYDFRDSAETRSLIDSIIDVRCAKGTARIPTRDIASVCRGIDVTIEFKGEHLSYSGVYLLASILEHFLGLYCSINSFTRLTAKVSGRSGDLRRWKPRAGERPLL